MADDSTSRDRGTDWILCIPKDLAQEIVWYLEFEEICAVRGTSCYLSKLCRDTLAGLTWISTMSFENPFAFEMLAKYATSLLSLTYVCSPTRHQNFVTILQNNRKLSHLLLVWGDYSQNGATDLLAVSQHCHNLTDLNIWNDGSSTIDLRTDQLADLGPRLTCLWLHSRAQYNLASLPNLELLMLQHPISQNSVTPARNRNIIEFWHDGILPDPNILAQFGELRQFQCHWREDLGPAIGKFLPKLEHLSIFQESPLIPSSGHLTDVAKGCPRLKILRIWNIEAVVNRLHQFLAINHTLKALTIVTWDSEEFTRLVAHLDARIVKHTTLEVVRFVCGERINVDMFLMAQIFPSVVEFGFPGGVEKKMLEGWICAGVVMPHLKCLDLGTEVCFFYTLLWESLVPNLQMIVVDFDGDNAGVQMLKKWFPEIDVFYREEELDDIKNEWLVDLDES